MVDKKRGTYEFGVKFPFSWIVKDNLESLLSHASEPDHGESLYLMVLNFNQSSYCSALNLLKTLQTL